MYENMQVPRPPVRMRTKFYSSTSCHNPNYAQVFKTKTKQLAKSLADLTLDEVDSLTKKPITKSETAKPNGSKSYSKGKAPLAPKRSSSKSMSNLTRINENESLLENSNISNNFRNYSVASINFHLDSKNSKGLPDLSNWRGSRTSVVEVRTDPSSCCVHRSLGGLAKSRVLSTSYMSLNDSNWSFQSSNNFRSLANNRLSSGAFLRSKQPAEFSSNKNAPLTKTVSSPKVSVPVNGVSGNKNSTFEVVDDQYDIVKRNSAPCKMAAETSALRRLEALFENVKLEKKEPAASQRKSLPGKRNSGHFFFERTLIEEKVDKNCDVHGKDSKKNDYGARRGSMGNILHSNRRSFSGGVGSRRDSMPALHVVHNHPPIVRRDSGGLGLPPAKSQDPFVHPSSFPSSLRKSSMNTSVSNLRKDSTSTSTGNLRGTVRRDSISSVGSGRRDSSLGRKFSTDSLDHRRNSWDPGRRGSSSSSGGLDEVIFEGSINGRGSIPAGR